MDLWHYLALARKWGWLILLIAGLAAAGSYLYSLTIPPTYRSEAILLVGQEQQNPNPTVNDIYVSNNLAAAYALLATQPSVLEAAAQAIHWDGPWQSLYFNVAATAPTGGQTIHIAATSRSPQQAQAIANEIAHQILLQSPVSQQQQAADAQRSFITDQQAMMQEQIVAGQKSLSDLNRQAALETDQAKLDDLDKRITALQTKIQGWQQTYLQMGALLNAGSGKFLTIIAAAPLPAAPISPNIPQNVLLAAFAGFILAIGVVLLLEYLDDTIKTSEDVQRVLKLTTLGSIARISPVHNPTDSLVTARQPRSPTAEDYRILRTNLRYAGIASPGSALLVTSANPSEGKTTTAANLAIAIAQSGKRVVLVDADLRRPSIDRVFGVDNHIGLSSLFLEDGMKLEDALLPTEVPGLRLLVSGELPPNPAEILDSKRMNEILLDLRMQSDMVVIDSPPLVAVADANILASRCSGAILVVDSGKTRSQVAQRVTETLMRSQVKILGVVLNRMSSRRGGYYRYYYYYGKGSSKKKGKAPERQSGSANGKNGSKAPATNGHAPEPQVERSMRPDPPHAPEAVRHFVPPPPPPLPEPLRDATDDPLTDPDQILE